jgi:hypothetical protein
MVYSFRQKLLTATKLDRMSVKSTARTLSRFQQRLNVFAADDSQRRASKHFPKRCRRSNVNDREVSETVNSKMTDEKLQPLKRGERQ